MQTKEVLGMMTQGIRTIGRPSDAVREIETQDGTLLLDIGQGLCFCLTAVGAMIWQRLKLNETPEQIASYLSLQFPRITCEVIQSDTADFIQEIQRKGILIACDITSNSIRTPHLLSLIQHPNSGPKRSRSNFLFVKALIGLLV